MILDGRLFVLVLGIFCVGCWWFLLWLVDCLEGLVFNKWWIEEWLLLILEWFVIKVEV